MALAQPGGFGDVAGDAYYSEPVAALATMGVFAGTECDAGFCPDEAIDRKTMAVWTVRVLDGSDPELTLGTTSSRFDDVSRFLPAWWVPFIERMAASGVTRGCGDGTNFCPSQHTTRAQMAIFLHRALVRDSQPEPEPETAPAGLEVLRREVVGSSGGVVEVGGTVVRVPAGAVDDPVRVEVREPLGVLGTEEGGAVVGVEHEGPLAAPVTVSWDVGHLSDAELGSVVVVRWDDALSQWLPVDVGSEIAGGVLTADIEQWSWVSWIAELQDTVANISQTFQEIFGRRVDAPKCDGGSQSG